MVSQKDVYTRLIFRIILFIHLFGIPYILGHFPLSANLKTTFRKRRQVKSYNLVIWVNWKKLIAVWYRSNALSFGIAIKFLSHMSSGDYVQSAFFSSDTDWNHICQLSFVSMLWMKVHIQTRVCLNYRYLLTLFCYKICNLGNLWDKKELLRDKQGINAEFRSGNVLENIHLEDREIYGGITLK
jgi:hypothetical protein